MLRKILESSRYMTLIGVISMLGTSIGTFVWGAWKTVSVLITLFSGTAAKDTAITAKLIEVMDLVLIATTLYMIAVGLYELFVDDLNLPPWLVFKDFDQLKSKVVSVVILVLAVSFLKVFVESTGFPEILMLAAATALVSYVLVIFKHDVGAAEEKHGTEQK